MKIRVAVRSVRVCSERASGGRQGIDRAPDLLSPAHAQTYLGTRLAQETRILDDKSGAAEVKQESKKSAQMVIIHSCIHSFMH